MTVRYVLMTAALLSMPLAASDLSAMQSAYQQAQQYFYPNVRPLVLNAELPFYWQQQGYWFSRQQAGGRHFYFADSLQQPVRQLDMAELARALGAGAVPDVDKLQLQLNRSDNGWQAKLQYQQQSWQCDLAQSPQQKPAQVQYQCQVVTQPTAVKSPDKRWQLNSVAHNLQLTELSTGRVQQLTTDGSADYAWGELNDWYQLDQINGAAHAPKRSTQFVWSKDSRFAATFVLDRRTMPSLHMLQNMPSQGHSAVLHSYKRALPGNDLRSHYQLAIVDTHSGKVTLTQLPPLETTQNWGDVSWHDDGFFYLVARDRGMRALTLWQINTAGVATIKWQERSGQFLDYAKHGIAWLDAEQFVFSSERDGWNHLYLQQRSGETRQLTRGDFVVRQLHGVDHKNQQLYFSASGRERGDPYFRYLYRIKLDGSALTLLTPEYADHQVSLAPDWQHFYDSYSRVDLPTVSTIRQSTDGSLLQTLAVADDSALRATGWLPPEPFSVPARDGTTPLYGLIYKPVNFDPAKRYAVVQHMYAGPHTIVSAKRFSRGFANTETPLAQLGVVVINLDPLGTAHRSRAFQLHSYKNLGDIGGPDYISGLQQLAAKRPYLDLSRVGAYGHSAGGYDAARALLKYGDFYKVAVASAGNHDHRMSKAWWPEMWMGMPDEGEHYDSNSNMTLAHQLEGQLLLATGDLDNNVNPANSFRLAAAIQAAGRDVDLLLLANKDHDLREDSYFTRRRWDYFVRHLLQQTPPAFFPIKHGS
ncbi:dipeptidyl aminopeptidase/acylaminoacyl peptidase [Rheinheimera pacifica]|uniref:S9 family peptidase n=1 Tax=Rheinheimera pacifica TaxID=173990 RepID=UPI00285BFFC0|nr:DPP IV N-terminal domain-containing protein [Rheinheimera pacifica]MDR6982309.1 dipeptidyl aminopeptidase/acylaminoacyl peptidase [Rheinheimera pacifica]